ncbi:hypothetical protein SAMN05444411_106203 [Lutibacter oricola]|uniref:Uracil DNA glycosylase superfamily protein n=1 Tax=Lutibacter oricola TaxID=762486 RepID=A0A1H3CM17_9FLAO|nr:hypothetical protein [Lutibacter oricola]SDX55203.1 hypothetical protein SAMN05444411_106203 [Lutibacter oricola]
MNKINLEENYKEKVLSIWEKHKNIPELNEGGFEYRKSPILPKYILKKSILFIGINPSFTQKSSIEEKNQQIEFYDVFENNEKDITYFEKFKDVAGYCDNSKWTHLDLFFLRETNQKIIEKLSYKSIEFLQDQLDITFEIIEKSEPLIIIVANSLASEFFGKKKSKHHKFDKIWKGFNLDFNKDFNSKIGTYEINIGGNKVPILFSGMLSGQRALDIGSLERLKWQVKAILKKDSKQ